VFRGQICFYITNSGGTVMKKLNYLIVLCLLTFVTGCHSVYTTHPIGNPPLKISAEKWDGTWINNDGSIVLKVTDPEKGHLIAALIESKQDDLKLEKFDIELRGTNDFIFINFKAKNKKENVLYVWGKIKKKEREIIIWGPNVEKFRELVKKGKLPGKIKNKDVYLDTLKDEHLKFITSEENALLFDLNNPGVFFRLTK